MISWNYIVVGLCLLLTVFLLWKEWRRLRRSRVGARLLATVLAVAALACIGLPLTYNRAEPVRATAKKDVPAEGNTGVVAVDWQRRLKQGERLQVQGRLPEGRKTRLLLMGLGGVLDSAENGGGIFSLSTIPAQVGRAVYRLVLVAGGDTVEREDIPVEVRAGRSSKILLLASSPDFENTFLVNWLATGGNQVASRTKVSKDKYQQAFVSMPERSLDKLTPGLLKDFDLVITDSSALPASGTAEWMALRQQVAGSGLGLLIRVDSAIGWGAWGVGMRGLVRDSLSRIVVGSSLYGAGKVVFSKRNTTFRLVLAGQQQAYASYWGMLLSLAAREEEPTEEWSWQPALPRVLEPVEAVLQTVSADMPQGLVGEDGGHGTTVYLGQDPVLPFFWRGIYWPEKEGWQAMRTLHGDTTWWYVWPAGAWGELYRVMGRAGAGGQGGVRAGLPGGDRVSAGGVIKQERVAIPKGWFCTIFLLSVFFLWAERKMGGMNGQNLP